MRIVIGSDNAGYTYKAAIKQLLEKLPQVESVVDLGVESSNDGEPYPLVAVECGERIIKGEADRGILICGTGLGVCISANKVPGIRAVTAHDSFSVERSIKSNNCQILCMGERVIGLELAKRLVTEWLTYSFDETSPSAEKLKCLTDYEAKHTIST